MSTFDHSLFSHHRKGALLSLVAELSALGVRAGVQTPRVISIRGARGVARFILVGVDRDAEGDVVAFNFEPEARSLRGLVNLVVFND